MKVGNYEEKIYFRNITADELLFLKSCNLLNPKFQPRITPEYDLQNRYLERIVIGLTLLDMGFGIDKWKWDKEFEWPKLETERIIDEYEKLITDMRETIFTMTKHVRKRRWDKHLTSMDQKLMIVSDLYLKSKNRIASNKEFKVTIDAYYRFMVKKLPAYKEALNVGESDNSFYNAYSTMFNTATTNTSTITDYTTGTSTTKKNGGTPRFLGDIL